MRFRTRTAAFIAAMLTTATAAGAQTTVTGTTTGCFGLGCTPGASTSYSLDGSGTALAFTGTTFTGITNSITNAFTVGNLGSIVLNGLGPNTTSYSFLGAAAIPFTLFFTFSAPTGATTASEVLSIAGVVGPNTRDISYTGSATSYTFGTGLGTVTVDGGQIGVTATSLSGRVTALAGPTVPEAASWAMMIVGVGLAGAALRRRETAKASFKA